MRRRPLTFPFPTGYVNVVAVAVVLVFLFAGSVLQKRMAVSLDEQVQTAQDYSVEVCDPDPEHMDPDEWRSFFSAYGEVTYVTVNLANGELLRLLRWRRNLLDLITMEELGENDDVKKVVKKYLGDDGDDIERGQAGGPTTTHDARGSRTKKHNGGYTQLPGGGFKAVPPRRRRDSEIFQHAAKSGFRRVLRNASILGYR